MVTPNPAPEANKTPSTAGPITDQGATDRDQNATGNPEAVTQSELASSDGAGIRGDYGDADQTNGLEGGNEQPSDASPDRAAANPTNTPQQ